MDLHYGELIKILIKYRIPIHFDKSTELIQKLYQLFEYSIIDETETDSEYIRHIACYYEYVIRDQKIAKTYLLKAIDKNNSKAMFSLAQNYQYNENNLELAIRYYLMAAERGHAEAMNDVGVYYCINEKNYVLAKKYYLMAIETKTDFVNSCPMSNIANIIHYREKNYNEAKKYYIMAANVGDDPLPVIKINKLLCEEFDPIFAIKCYQYLDEQNLNSLNIFIIKFH